MEIPREFESGVRYRIVREIAEGGMGKVYEAVQLGSSGFEKTVALKIMLSSLNYDERFIDMLIDEGRLVSCLVHENIVQILNLGKAPFGHYLVMEYVNGLALADLIEQLAARGRVLPPELATFIAARIARGLAYAHSRTDAELRPLNIVHRDVCPGNILLTTEGLPKLTDFGVAKAKNNIMPANDQCLLGKLTYMPPEQALRKGAEPRSDIYALGMVLLEMLSGRHPREAATDTDMQKLAGGGCVNLGALPEDLDADLRDILYRALQPDPAHRWQTAAEFSTALEYHIYKGGYGPTVATLEAFLRREAPQIFLPRKRLSPS